MPTKTSQAGRQAATKPDAETDAQAEPKVLLHSLRLTNFLSFGPDAPEIKLGPLNILIGANGAGKSNLIEAIGLLRSTPVPFSARGNSDIQSIISNGGGAEEWVGKRSPDEPAKINAVVSSASGKMPLRHGLIFASEQKRFRLRDESIEDKSSSSPYYYWYDNGDASIVSVGKERRLKPEAVEADVSILAQRNDPEAYPEITHLIRQYSKIAIYRDWTFGRDTVYRQPQKADGRVDRLEEDFSNLGLFLNRLYGVPKTKRDLLSHLRDLYAEVDDLHIEIFAGNVQIVFNEGDFRIPATRLSDGTLRYLCLLAILCDPTPPPLICIEEPELGLHPDLLPKIADLLVEASSRTQLIVTTHSTILVDAMTERPDCVLVCEKHDGQTQMTRLSQNDLAQWMGKYRLGQLWTRGEIGGNRW